MSGNEQKKMGVIVIGAGAAGLTAAFHLKRKDIPVTILEAHDSKIGGRVRKLENFADFPIDLGAEWISFRPRILRQIIGDDQELKEELDELELHRYKFAPMYQWDHTRGKWRVKWHEADEQEILWKFINYTWYDFFNDFFAQRLRDDIHLGCVVNTIDYSDNMLRVSCQNGQYFEANQVIVAVPLSILKDNDITFSPPIPAYKRRAINRSTFDPGMKVFLEFNHKFYHNNFELITRHNRNKRGEMYFYDATQFEKQQNRHILGIFAYSDMAKEYVKMNQETLIQEILIELDAAYGGNATKCFVRAHVQNWTVDEPYIRGNYSSFRRGMRPMYSIGKPIASKVFFAGEYLPPDGVNYGYASHAALSGKEATQAVIAVRNGDKPGFPWRQWAVHILGTVCCGLEQKLFFYDIE